MSTSITVTTMLTTPEPSSGPKPSPRPPSFGKAWAFSVFASAMASVMLILTAMVIGQKASLAAFDAHGGPVKSVAVSTDGRLALTASFDNSILLWDLADETVRAELEGHDAAVNAVAFLPNNRQAVSASDDGTIAIWDLVDGTLLTRQDGHDGKVVAIAVSPAGTLIASAGWDRTIRLWGLKEPAEIPTLSPIQTLSTRDNPNAVGFSADNESVIAGTSDGGLTAWRVTDGTRTLAVNSHDFAVTGLDQHVEDSLVATSSVDETVRLWDLETAGDSANSKPIATLYGHQGPVLSVDLSPKGELVASGGVDGTVRVWKRGDGDRLRVFARHRGPVWSVIFAPDGKTLLSGGADGLVLTYDLTTPDETPATRHQDDLLGRDLTAGSREDVTDNSAGTGPARGEKLFKACAACHTLTAKGGRRAGPSLHGIFGRTAGSLPGYRYSDTLIRSDLIWTDETIDELFAIGPDHLLPGTKMPLQRMPDDQDRADLIAFLKQATKP